MKPRVASVIVVEGKYDAQRVRDAVDATVVETGGFRLFRDPEKREMIRRLAAARGVIVLTDSDAAGAVIRNHLLSFLPPEQVRLAYVPPRPGKERRKAVPSKEGLLGVEAMDDATLVEALEKAGAFTGEPPAPPLTKGEMVELGLSGQPDSAARRQALLHRLGLPSHLSANRLAQVLPCLLTPQELEETVSQL
ncbi:MAG: DUF4093 domain-containing protein [Ruminococcaceae bacterium]|nr:DUF4093 domain-containing protein [Oscillospiraceae bacterium]